MTRKDYVRIANALGRAFKVRDVTVKSTLACANEIAKELAEDNSSFRPEQFLEAVVYAMNTFGVDPVKVGQKNFPLPSLSPTLEEIAASLGITREDKE